MTQAAQPGAGRALDAVSHAELKRCVRDLMSLLALPAITGGLELPAILQRFCESLHSLLELRACAAVSPPVFADEPEVCVLQIDHLQLEPDAAWAGIIAAAGSAAGADCVEQTIQTPLGTLQAATLQLGYPGGAGWLFAASDRPDFPTLTEAAVLRAGASLAAGSLKASRLMHESEAAARAKDEFLAMLGHELRNPLAPIVTALQLMKLRGDTTSLREQGVIQRQVVHLQRLVDDLLDVSRITRGKIELRLDTVEIAEVIDRAVEMTALLFEQREHQLTIDVVRTGLSWRGDAMRMAQVVSNLLSNAARYTPIGGHVQLRVWREGARLVIGVQDNGIGMAPELLPRVFELFFQGRQSIERKEGGLGLGLALVRSLVQLHGGEVWARSAGVTHGSEFFVSLPAALPAPPAGAPLPLPPVQAPAAASAQAASSSTAVMSASESGPAGSGTAARVLRVLVVDDNVDAADLLASILALDGHDVRVAYDPAQALALIEVFDAEIAVLDIGLPVMDGYELAPRLRARRPLRLIALSGYGGRQDLARSREIGFEQHLVKPVDFQLLARLVAQPATPAPAAAP